MNYANLVTLIQDELINEETTFVTHIPDFVKMAEDDIYANTQLPDLRKPVQGTLTSSNEFLSLPTDFLSQYSVAVIDSGTHYYLLNKEAEFIRAAYPSRTSTGRPKYYALLDDDSIIVGPTPDSGYTVEMHYFYKPQSIVDTSTSWLGTNAPNALIYGSLLHGYIYMKGDDDMAKYYKDEYLRALSNLQILTEGRVRKDTYRSMNVRADV